jgi:hypothetical protein
LHAGIKVLEFWDLTPRETFMAIDASLWREEIQQKRDLTLAWQTAALTRAKRLPSLKQLLNTKPARPLHGAELEKRRQEFKEMTAKLDVSKLKRPKRNDAPER